MARLKYYNQLTQTWDYADTSGFGGGNEVTREYVDVKDAETLTNARSYTSDEIRKTNLKIANNSTLIEANKRAISNNTSSIEQNKILLNTKVTNKKGVSSVWSGTQNEYDSIPSIDPNTIYFITE